MPLNRRGILSTAVVIFFIIKDDIEKVKNFLNDYVSNENQIRHICDFSSVPWSLEVL